MILSELTGSEAHPIYQTLAVENLNRQYGFLKSAVIASLAIPRPLLSLEIIKALNYHAISCLHPNAGEWRPCPVTVGEYIPPDFYRVPSLMNLFVDEVNRHWVETDPVVLATFVLWKLNNIHPFINGNGRTARVVCYFVLCLKISSWLPGDTLLPELIREGRPEYVSALKAIDASVANGHLDLSPLHAMIARLLNEQVPPTENGDGEPTPPAANIPSIGETP